MKFLCLSCDEPMKLAEAVPPEGGNGLAATFRCPTCGNGIAMLTNPWETEVVTSLGVRIGPGQKEAKCPFSGVVQSMQPGASPHAADAPTTAAGVAWTEGALARLERIPEMVRPMARMGIEQMAKADRRPVVDEALLDEARGRFGM